MTAKAEKGKHLTGNKAHLGDIVGSVPDHRNKMNIAIKEVAGISCFPRAIKRIMRTGQTVKVTNLDTIKIM